MLLQKYFKVAALILLAAVTTISAGELVQTSGFSERDLIFKKSNNYDVVDLAGCPALGKAGSPRLPHLSLALSIPAGATVTGIEIVGIDEKMLEGTYNVIPAQKPVPLPMPGRTFTQQPPMPDQAVYSRNEIFPANAVRAMKTGSMCGYRIGQVEISPVRYNPVTKKLYFASRITYRVTYRVDRIEATVSSAYQQESFGRQVRALVSNPGDVSPFAPAVKRALSSKALPAGLYPYVTVSCSASFDTVYGRLAEWKTKKGLRDTVVPAAWIYANYAGYDNAEKLRNFINDARETWGTVYVLLGGQGDDLNSAQNQISCRHAYYTASGEGAYSDEDYIPSDLYYGDLDGTWDLGGNHVWGEVGDSVDMYPDVFIGRAPASTRAQAQNFVNKVLEYEKNPPAGYLTKMLLPAAILWSDFEERAIQRPIADMTPLGWTDDSLFERNVTLSRAAMVSSMNDGRGLGHWVGHGNEFGIYYSSGAYYNSADAIAASNGSRQGISISIACMTGGMDLVNGGDCFAEHIINRAGGGCAGVMMNSRYGWGGVSELIDTTFYSVLFRTGQYRLGQVLASAKSAWIPEAQAEGEGGMMRWCLYELNLFGDPEMPLWTDEPESIAVAQDSIVPVGHSDLAVTVTGKSSGLPVAGALVCAMTPDKAVYVCGTTDASGLAVLNIYPPAEDTLYITVTSRNKLPAENYALIRSAGAYVSYLKYSVVDSAGNGDGIVNPGETVLLPLWVRNFGTDASSGAVACTLSNGGGVVMTDSIYDFGVMASGDSSLYVQGFGFTVAASCTNATILPFTLRCRDNTAGWSASFHLQVGAPALVRTGRGISGTGLLDPGTVRDITVDITNYGQSNAGNVTGRLQCGDAWLVVTDSVADFGAVACQETIANSGHPFSVSVSGGAAVGDSVTLTLILSGDGMPDAVSSWREYIGDIRLMPSYADGYYAVEDSDLVSRHPEFQWIEIRGNGGTQVFPGDDGAVNVQLPFAFTWYGNSYDTITICGNSWVGLGTVTPSGYYLRHQHLPTAASEMPRPAVFSMWADLDPSNTTYSGAWVGYRYDAAQQRFVVQYDSVPYYGINTRNSFQIILYDSTGDDAAGCLNHDAVCQYKKWNDLGNCGIGIQNADGTKGLDIYYNGVAGNSGRLLGFYSGKAMRYTMEPGQNLTGISEIAPAPLVPQKHVLLHNTPNPFRGSTEIRFKLARSGIIKLQVYNITGQLVRSLFQGEKQAGSYAVKWDGRDQTGLAVSSGIYLYRLSTPEHSIMEKMTLIR